MRFSLPNPYDILLFYDKSLILLELKSTIGTSFSFDSKTPMIKKHQIEELTKASKHNGITAGFVFHLDKYKKTYFLEINNFNKFKDTTDKKSINQQDIIQYGAIEINGKIKKVRTKYNIEEFVKEIQELDKQVNS